MIKILIVDDDTSVLETMVRFIEDAIKLIGIDRKEIELYAIYCHLALDALLAVQGHEPDILFLDYSFRAGTNARSVAQWIDEQYKKPIKVITHTHRTEERARELFAGTKCVTHFLGHENREENVHLFIREFLRDKPA